jgi:hypothetical protein
LVKSTKNRTESNLLHYVGLSKKKQQKTNRKHNYTNWWKKNPRKRIKDRTRTRYNQGVRGLPLTKICRGFKNKWCVSQQKCQKCMFWKYNDSDLCWSLSCL